MTFRQKREYIFSYLGFLKTTYALPSFTRIDLSLHDNKSIPLGSKKANGTIQQLNSSYALIEVSCGRDISKVLLTVGHEYKHCLQIFREGADPYRMGKRHEEEAHTFAAKALGEYIKTM